MPVIALYEFNEAGEVATNSAGTSVSDGTNTDGAEGLGGRLQLDGLNDKMKVGDEAFQLDRGTLEIQFSVTALTDDPQTVLSRDSVGQTAGGYRIEVLVDGSVAITHETEGGETTYTTGPGFLGAGDEVNVSYSWDAVEGGKLVVANQTAGTTYEADTPEGLTMDMGDINQKWMVGSGQSASDPWLLNNLDKYMEGSVEYFQISDSVDNDTDPTRDGIVEGSNDGDLIDLDYDGDPDGDFVDNDDALIPGDAPNDDRIYAYGGDDTVLAGEGDDTVYGGRGNDDIDGEEGDDSLRGGRGDDTLTGGDGNDTLRGADGDDLLDSRDPGAIPLPDRGYPGLYPADTDPTNDLDLVSGGDGNDTIRTGDDNDTVFGGRDDDDIDGGFDDDGLFGGFGNDTIVGAEGSDTIQGRQDDDLIFGGYGPDIPDEVNIPDDEGDLVPDNGRDSIFGGFGNDTIYGMDDDDTIYGGADNDLIDAGIDDDLVYGDRGNDTINGGQGVDSLYGGADRDVFVVGRDQGTGDFIDGNEGGDDFDTLDLSGAGPLRIDYERNPENGTVTFLDDDGNETGTLTFRNIENVIPCFTPGTLVATPKGEVPVESLEAGDQIITRDNGIQTIRWTGHKHLDWAALSANPHLKPILIRQGSLGNGLPERDMLVSPNHRMLVANDRTALYFAEHEVLVAAKHLVGSKGVQAIDSMGTTYIHFMFDRHEVVLANGAWTESFQPGDQTLKGMGNAQRNEIFELFPELRDDVGIDGYAAARRTLKRHEARLLVAR
ncbi:MAG: Hint domain-containing protein [Gemmobacter sp.]